MGIKSFFKNFGHSLKNFVTHTIPQGVKHLGHSIKTFVHDIPKHISDAVKWASGTAKDAISNVGSGVGSATGSILKPVTNSVTSITSSLVLPLTVGYIGEMGVLAHPHFSYIFPL